MNRMLWLSSIFDCGLVCHYGCMLVVNLTDLIVNLLYLLLFDLIIAFVLMVLYSLLCMCTGLYVAIWEKKREMEEKVSLLQTCIHMHQFIY
jgi:cytochrome c oxidase assembly protein Cox11